MQFVFPAFTNHQERILNYMWAVSKNSSKPVYVYQENLIQKVEIEALKNDLKATGGWIPRTFLKLKDNGFVDGDLKTGWLLKRNNLGQPIFQQRRLV